MILPTLWYRFPSPLPTYSEIVHQRKGEGRAILVISNIIEGVNSLTQTKCHLCDTVLNIGAISVIKTKLPTLAELTV